MAMDRSVGILMAAVLLAAAGCASRRQPASAPPGNVVERAPHPPGGSDATENDLPTLGAESGLSDYLAYAALNNPGLEAAFNRWQAAMKRVPQARALPDPDFAYRVYIEQVETRVGPQRQGFRLSQMFPWFGKLDLRGDVASEAAKAAAARYHAAKLDLFYRVKDAYYEYYYLGRAIAIVRRNLELLSQVEELARTRYKAGKADYSNVMRAQVELGKLDDRLRTLIDLGAPAAARLDATLNRPADAPVPWPDAIAEERMIADDDEVLEVLRRASPELLSLRHEVERERVAIELAGKDYFPDVMLGVDYVDTGHASMSGVADSGKDPVIATVSIKLPIWHAKYAAGVLEAHARYRAASKALAERENALVARVRMVLYRFRDAARRIELYRDGLMPTARQALKAVEAGYRAGEVSFIDMLDAQRALLELELSYERALADHAQRLAEVEMLVGEELPRAPLE